MAVRRTAREFLEMLGAPVSVSTPRSKPLHVAVSVWWAQRRATGDQLSRTDFIPGYDYKGEGRWKREVTVQALHQDFMTSPYAVDCSSTEFINALQVCAPEIQGFKRRRASTKNAQGRVVLRPIRRFVQFRGIGR